MHSFDFHKRHRRRWWYVGLTGGKRRYVGLTAIMAALVLVPLALAGAINTTTDAGQQVNGNPTGVCLNGPDPSVNCNIYSQQEDVFLSGSPVQASLGAGTYYFAVLDPGGQRNPNPGADDLLSSDGAIQREFSLNSAGMITNLGDHLLDSNKLSVFPYNPTSNPGGVYILAVCQISSTESTAAIDPVPTVEASDCKYDAFKVKAPEENTAFGPSITKDATGSYTTTYTWDISKSASPANVEQVGGNAAFTYTVQVTHDAGSLTSGSVKVTGIISIFDTNVDDQNKTAPLSITSVTDTLSDGTPCVVTGGGSQTLTDLETDFSYVCDLSAIPTTSLDNVATVTWPTQTINGATLTGGSKPYTFTDISFSDNTANDVGSCTTVTDTLPSAAITSDDPFSPSGVPVCIGETTPYHDGGAGTGATDGFTFVYHVSYPVPTNNCTSYTNYAQESADDNQAHATVQACGPANTGALTMGFWKGPNGQALISNYGSGLYAWLHVLGPNASGPFSSVTSLSDINAIFKAASATNMNAMLRAQMLATALDYYFSTTGKGWSTTAIGKIKPPSNFLTQDGLANFTMDMTSICPMVDNLSTGTATCSGNKPSTDGNSAGAFPSASMTVLQLLNYEASNPPYTTAGSPGVWYAGDRTKEEIAKNAFDQINNGDAFAG